MVCLFRWDEKRVKYKHGTAEKAKPCNHKQRSSTIHGTIVVDSNHEKEDMWKYSSTWHHCCWQQPWERRHVKVFFDMAPLLLRATMRKKTCESIPRHGTIIVDSNHEKENMWKYSFVAKCMVWHKTLKWYHEWGWTSKLCESFKCPNVTQAHLLLVELEELLKLPIVKASSLWELLEVFHHLSEVQATLFLAILKTQGIKAARK